MIFLRFTHAIIKNLKICIFISLLLNLTLCAEAQFEVKGRITDSLDRQLDYINVSVFNKDNSMLKATISDSLGNYSIKSIPGGVYNIEFSHINYQEKILQVRVTRDTILDVKLQDRTNDLQTLVVNSKKPVIERKIDRTVFNVQNMVTTAGGNALESLQKIPGVRVRNDLISLVGKSSIKIMVNDKITPLSGEDLLTFLRSIPNENVSKIEIITSPPAKYDAEGNSGLINIITTKAKMDSWNAGINYTYLQSEYGRHSVSGNFNYQKDKLSLTANINYKYGAREKRDSAYFYYPDKFWGTDRKY